MHIPDGFLNIPTSLATTALAAGALGFALRQTSRTLPPNRIPFLGLTGAFVFAAQMVNFPVLGGTSGHLIGGALTAILLGPSASIVVISTVLMIQCLLFSDGGITALGANILNMAMVGGVGSWAMYWLLARLAKTVRQRAIIAALAAWAGTVAASFACSAELTASHMADGRLIFPMMLGVHALIGIGEGLITALVLVTLMRTWPDLVGTDRPAAPAASRYLPVLVYGAITVLAIAFFAAPYASTSPDGLDASAEHLNFADRAASLITGPLADYQIPFIPVRHLSIALAGIVGAAGVFGISAGLTYLLALLGRKRTFGHSHS